MIALLILILLAMPVLALENPEPKAADAIKGYIQTKFPGWTKDEIRLSFKMAEGVFAEMKKLDEKAELKVLEVYPDFKPVGNVIFPLETGGSKFMVRAHVEVVKKILAAARPIKKGMTLEPADLKTDERDVALLPQKFFTDANLLAGKEAKISIPQNSTLFDWMIGEVPLVHRGDKVSLIVSGGALAVKTKAVALEDGYLNSDIRVKRADSKKIITGKLIAKGEVEVKL